MLGPRRPLISVMLANNETGVIQPIADIAEIVHAANGLLHVDAVQAPGRIACDMEALGADLMTISSHKLGGPQGAGALIRRGEIHIAEPLIKGGGQERGLRARNRERRRHRRLRRGRRGCGCRTRRLTPRTWPRCAIGWKPASRRQRRRR